MIFRELDLGGPFLIEGDRLEDERGFFARIFVREEFESHGLDTRVAQVAVSFNRRKATLRGLHYQVAPHEQAKLVRCTRGAIYDVILDLRPDSPTHLRWAGVELRAADLNALFVPAGFAHGFETLEDDCEVWYHISAPYHPESERGLRWNDPALAISWPAEPAVISPRDQKLPLLLSTR